MYKDIAEKYKIQKELIIQSFIDRGIYPTDELIRSRIDNIDLSLSLLYVEEAIQGECFDINTYNKMINSIYNDLKILYKILFELTVKDYTLIKAYCDTHLEDLERKVNYYLLKSTEEVASTSIGKTIFFQSDSFNIKQNNSSTIIYLGNIDITNGSNISCFITGSGLNLSNIVFSLTSDKTYYITPYNVNNDFFKEPHQQSIKLINYTSTKNVVSDTLVPMQIENLNKDNKYTILAGKNLITVKQFGETTKQVYRNAPLSFDMLGFNEKSYIDFYVLNSKSISFRLNKSPVATNFPIKNEKIEINNYIEHFFIECDAGFAFDFELEGGTVFAAKEIGIIKNEKLCYPKTTTINDFLIIEQQDNNKTKYSINCEIINNDYAIASIDSIYIKELSKI